MYKPHQVTKEFEAALCDYTGARFAVTTNSCTSAILLACAWYRKVYPTGYVSMPKRSYVGVPASIKHAGFEVTFRDEEWSGEYQLSPLPVWDSARRTTSDMYRHGQMQCLSLHWAKILGLQQGGVILHDNPTADEWLRRARFDGRTEGVDPAEDSIDFCGWHCYLSPEIAALGLMKLSLLPMHNEDLKNSNYPDLSLMKAFK